MSKAAEQGRGGGQPVTLHLTSWTALMESLQFWVSIHKMRELKQIWAYKPFSRKETAFHHPEPWTMSVSLLLGYGVRPSPLSVLPNKLQRREQPASKTATTRAQEVCQQKRAPSDGAGKETEVRGGVGVGTAGSSANELCRSQRGNNSPRKGLLLWMKYLCFQGGCARLAYTHPGTQTQ